MSFSSSFRKVLILEKNVVCVLLNDISKTVFLINNSFSRRILVQRFSYGIYRSRSRHEMLAQEKEERQFSE